MKLDDNDFIQTLMQDRLALSKEAKAKGNSLYSAKKYDLAIEEYTRAIDYMPDAVYYSNRAACYSNLVNTTKRFIRMLLKQFTHTFNVLFQTLSRIITKKSLTIALLPFN